MKSKITNTTYGKTTCRENLKNPHDGWILRQMQKGEIVPLFKVDNSSNRMAGKIRSITASILNYEIKRLYRRKEDGSYAFFFAVKGGLDGATIAQLNNISDLLLATFENDYASYFAPYSPQLTSMFQTKLNIKHEMVYLYFEVSFGSEWNPGEDFQEVNPV